jgi:BRCT domain type II-containing protein
MAWDLCTACGEEHEAPRGGKCKRTKIEKTRKLKLKIVEEPLSEVAASDSAAEASIGWAGESLQRKKELPHICKHSVNVVEDEEEQELWERLE